jgi:uncharacterized protein (DUF362 family)
MKMSFFIDPPLLVLSGMAIFLLGKELNWSRHAKIVVGLFIVLVFVAFSSLLYADFVRFTIPFFANQTGSAFMFHTDITHIHKDQIPKIAVFFLFLLYPVWIFAGYAAALLWDKRKFAPEEGKSYSYADVKSRSRRTVRTEQLDLHTAVERGNDTRKCVREAVKKLGGMGKFVHKGDRVLVKVNICGGLPERKGTFTSLEVADELYKMIREAEGVPTFADADMVWIKFQQAARDSGYIKWAEENGVRLINLSETKVVNFDFGEQSALQTEKVSLEAIQADVIISVPAMKTHLLTGVTLAMKNMYGTFPDIDKAKFHKTGIEDVIFEINSAFTPNLVIIDGSMGGEAIGPLSADPVYYETIIASDDVVEADSIACQMMGYPPLEIIHIRKAYEAGLGDASALFNFDSLPYPHAKDRMWDRPKIEVTEFYEWAIEVVLMFPGWDTLFNIGADFLLYDLSHLPVFSRLMPAVLSLLQDGIYPVLKENKRTARDVARQVININLMVLVALGCAIGYYLDGYIAHSSLIYELGMLLGIFMGFLAAVRMKTIHFVALLAISGLAGIAVEFINTHSSPNLSVATNVLTYNYGDSIIRGSALSLEASFIYIACGWMVMMLSILQVSDLLTGWITNLGIFAELRRWKVAPLAAILVIFSLFFVWEGYYGLAYRSKYDGIEGIVLIMYAIMAVLGMIYSSRHSIEWNATLLIVALFIGGYMELTGSLAGLWVYPFHEKLAVFFALTWPLNTMAVHGVAYLLGIDLGAHERRSLLKNLK